MTRLKTTSLACAFALSLVACGSNGPAPGEVKLSWLLGFGVQCDATQADIDTIRVRLRLPERAVVDQEYSCSSGTATLTNVPPGTYALEVQGGKGANFDLVVFRATVPVVLVSSSEVTDVGKVQLEKVPPSENPGGLELSWTFESGLCGANQVENVRVVVWRDLVFRQFDQAYACDIPAPGYVHLDLEPGQYGVTLEGIDVEGRTTRRGQADGITIEQGKTIELKGSNAIVLAPF
ncbi:MAG: hypothetical protein KC503_19445 [Myxococcales bacterium]|nr:hypothetical protein [Myxococcales bacterium]